MKRKERREVLGGARALEWRRFFAVNRGNVDDSAPALLLHACVNN